MATAQRRLRGTATRAAAPCGRLVSSARRCSSCIRRAGIAPDVPAPTNEVRTTGRELRSCTRAMWSPYTALSKEHGGGCHDTVVGGCVVVGVVCARLRRQSHSGRLANGPSIQRAQPVEPTGEGVHDAVSNGADSCGADGRSALVGHWPPCTGEGRSPLTPPSRNDVLPPPSGEVRTRSVQRNCRNSSCAGATSLPLPR